MVNWQEHNAGLCRTKAHTDFADQIFSGFGCRHQTVLAHFGQKEMYQDSSFR